MDVVWDQDVRHILSGIIGRERAIAIVGTTQFPVPNDEDIRIHIRVAIRYADLLQEERNKKDRKPPEVQYRPRGNR